MGRTLNERWNDSKAVIQSLRIRTLVIMSLIPPNPPKVGDELGSVCTPEHCFYAFDTLFCALTSNTSIDPSFPDDK